MRNRLPIHARLVQISSGCSRTDRLLECPEGTTVPLDRCMHCGWGENAKTAVSDGFVVCSRVEAPGPWMPSPGADVICSLADGTLVSEAITSEVICLRPDVTLDEAMRMLEGGALGGAPVVDASGHVLGIISRNDLLRERLEAGSPFERRTVAAAMTLDVIAISACASIAQAAALMAFERVHWLPVVSPRGTLVGLLTPDSLLRWLGAQLERDGPESHRWLELRSLLS